MEKIYIIANWKKNLCMQESKDLSQAVINYLEDKEYYHQIVLCPPFTYLNMVKSCLIGSDVKLGAQDCSSFNENSLTGDVDAKMLADVHCDYVILGHSERRIKLLEHNELLRNKILNAQSSDLKVIYCVGELAEDREKGNSLQVVREQLDILSMGINTDLIVAYEPCWAIGSGRVPSAEEITEMTNMIKEELYNKFKKNIPIIYGGSVNKNNIRMILSQVGINGVLIGGASLDIVEFTSILSLSIEM